MPFTYGQIQAFVEEQSNSDFTYGYGTEGRGEDGYNFGSYITINAESSNFIGNTGAMVSVGLEEAFENITGAKNIGGTSSLVTIQTEGILNGKGIDLFTYTFVMTADRE